MPALPVIANTYRVALSWELGGGQTAANVIHILKAASTAAAVMAQLDAAATQAMWFGVSSNASVNKLTCTPLDGISASQILGVSGAKWSGNSAGAECYPGASPLVSLRTAGRGRSRRGRIYLPFGAEASQADGELSGGVVTSGQTAWDTWLATMIAATFQPVVASYKLALAFPVLNVSCETPLATQRRRQGRLR